MEWEAYGFIVAGKCRRSVCLALLNHPKTPHEVSTEIGISPAHVSRALKELVGQGIVRCLNPERRKGRVYSLTGLGLKVSKVMVKKEPT